MNIVLSTTLLASVLAPAYSFSYLDTLNGAPAAVAAPAPVAPAPVAPAPVAAAPVAAAPYTPAPVAVVSSGGTYFDCLHSGEEVRGPGLMTHVDILNTGTSTLGGAGIHTYAESLPSLTSRDGGAGITTYCDALSPTTGAAPTPFGSSGASPSFSGAASADGVTFTLETGDISALIADIKAGATLKLTGSINSITAN